MPVKEAINVEIQTKLKIPRKYKVLIYNDDFTPMNFVVTILQTVFDKQYQEAIRLMMCVQNLLLILILLLSLFVSLQIFLTILSSVDLIFQNLRRDNSSDSL